jgi:hypothetical protein
MTCIVGLVHSGAVWMGADSAGVDGRLGMVLRKDPKVFINGPFLMGFTTSFRMGQLLAHSLNAPKRHPDQDVYSFMVKDFVNAVRDCLKSGGFATVSNGVETGGTFLVGYEGRLFRIEGDFQVGEPARDYDACGCGEDLALGSLFATTELPPKQRVTHALMAAAAFSAGVSAPFNLLQIGATKTKAGGEA